MYFMSRCCCIPLEDGSVLPTIRLRCDLFFKHWPLTHGRVDHAGQVRTTAQCPYNHPKCSEVALVVDRGSGLLLRYTYEDETGKHYFALNEADYTEVPPDVYEQGEEVGQ